MNMGNLKFTQCNQILPIEGMPVKNNALIKIKGYLVSGRISIVFEDLNQNIKKFAVNKMPGTNEINHIVSIPTGNALIKFEISNESTSLEDLCSADLFYELLS